MGNYPVKVNIGEVPEGQHTSCYITTLAHEALYNPVEAAALQSSSTLALLCDASL